MTTNKKSYFEQLSLKTKVSEIAPLFLVNDDKFTWSVSQEAIAGATANPNPVKDAFFKKFLLFILILFIV